MEKDKEEVAVTALTVQEQISNLEESLATLSGRSDPASLAQYKAHQELLGKLKGTAD